MGPVTISTYTKNTDLPAPEALNTTEQLLLIDQAKAFNFQVDDVDQAQIRPSLMASAMEEAAFGLSDVSDTLIGTRMAAGVDAGNFRGTDAAPIAITPANAYTELVELSVILSDDKVPMTGRWAIVSPAFHGKLLQDDRFVRADASGSADTLRNGLVGRAAGFDILITNSPPVIGANKVMLAGNRNATSFAEQINKTEAYRPPLRFADAVKGLHLYGTKVTRPTGLAGIKSSGV